MAIRGEREAYRPWVRRHKCVAACELRLRYLDGRTSKGNQHPEGRWNSKSPVRAVRDRHGGRGRMERYLPKTYVCYVFPAYGSTTGSPGYQDTMW